MKKYGEEYQTAFLDSSREVAKMDDIPSHVRDQAQRSLDAAQFIASFSEEELTDVFIMMYEILQSDNEQAKEQLKTNIEKARRGEIGYVDILSSEAKQ